MSDKLEILKRKLLVAKSRAIFIKGTLTSYYPSILVLAGMTYMVYHRLLTPYDVMDLIFIAIYSAATTFQIHVLYSPERYDNAFDDLKDDSMFAYLFRHLFYALPTLLIVLPAAAMYIFEYTGLVAVAALGFVTLTNIILILKKSAERNMGKPQWVEF